MLLNVITVILVLYAIASPYFYARAFKFGMKVMEKPEEAAAEPFFHVTAGRKKPKMTPEEMRTTQILANIDAYNGTSLGQKVIRKDRA